MAFSSATSRSAHTIQDSLRDNAPKACCNKETTLKATLLVLALLCIAGGLSVGVWGEVFLPQIVSASVPRLILASTLGAAGAGLCLAVVLTSVKCTPAQKVRQKLEAEIDIDAARLVTYGDLDAPEVNVPQVQFDPTVPQERCYVHTTTKGGVIVAIADRQVLDQLRRQIEHNPENFSVIALFAAIPISPPPNMLLCAWVPFKDRRQFWHAGVEDFKPQSAELQCRIREKPFTNVPDFYITHSEMSAIRIFNRDSSEALVTLSIPK